MLFVCVVSVSTLTFFEVTHLFNLTQYSKKIVDDIVPKKALAVYQFSPTGGTLIIGTATTTVGPTYTDTWKATRGNDSTTNGSGNYWTIARTASGLDAQLQFDGVELQGANKLLVTMEDTNQNTASAYVHQICDWVSSTGVDNTTDAQCTGGGWRTLQPRKTAYTTNNTDTTRVYEIYDGYFSTRTATPGTPISTPLTNFVDTTSKRVLIRASSTVSGTQELRIDYARVEVAIDSFYEPYSFATTSAGATTNYLSDLVGAVSTNLTASDNTKMTIPMASASQPADFNFTFNNVKTLTGMNTILVQSEICVSNVALQFNIYLYNYNTSTWTQGGATTTGTACATDTEYGFSFNDTLVPGFVMSDHIRNGEVKVRFLTSSTSVAYNMQFDRIYLMVGAVNNDTAQCEISWGSGTATNCDRTRSMGEGIIATPTTTTWQSTVAIEYPANHHSLDNDDDATNGEYAQSMNLSFPMTVASNTSITGIHYAVKFRAGTTTITNDVQLMKYGGSSGVGGEAAGSAWISTPGTDTNALTTYSYFDTWRIAELEASPEDTVDTVNNRMNIRLRTSASTNIAGGTTNDWDFAMVGVRWVEEPKRVTVTTQYLPTSGTLIIGTATTTVGPTYTDTWKATRGNDSTTNGSGNYWTIARTASGLDAQLQFDGVELQGANKLLVTMEDTNQNTASAYVHQICDWVSSTGVDNTTDAQCTGGGWRTLQPRKTAYTTNNTDTTRVYEIYDGYFSTRTATPGTPISTPLTNFVDTTSKRVLIRASSTVSGTQELRIDYARVEVAIDSFYEPYSFATTSAGATTNYLSDLVGAVSTNLTASDNTKMTIPMASASQPADFNFTFNNVKTLTGMNTILVQSEICVSNVALQFNIYLYNYNTSTWTQGGATTTGTACATDTEYGFSFNDTLVPGFVMSDHIRNGEVKVRFLTSSTSVAYNMQFDRIYLMVGAVNNDTAQCEISWGSGTATNCDRTRSMGEGIIATPTTTTWQSTVAIEYPANHHSLDNDDDATNGEYAQSMNLSFPMTVASNTSITGIHYAVKFRAGTTTITNDVQLMKYGGSSGVGGEAAGSAWISTPGTDTNALTTYSYFDTWRIAELEASPEDTVDTVNNRMNIRLRTSASTNIAGGTTNDWDFAMVGVRWVEKNPPPYIAFTISDNSVGFGTLSAGESRYATGNLLGTTTDSQAHTLSVTTNAASGYVVTLSGATLTCSGCGGATITPIGSTATTVLPGTEQFGVRYTLLSGTGTTSAPYDTGLYAFDTANFPDTVLGGLGDSYTSVFGAYYLANVTSETESGTYTGTVTYTVTGTY